MIVENAKKLLGNVFVMYMKAHAYHWNYVGENFPQYHTFFGDLYEDLHGSTDVIAEHIRAMDAFAPGSLARLVELSTIKEDPQIPNPKRMVLNLDEANEEVLACLTECYEIAGQEKCYGFQNYVQDRIEIHKKHRWMLKATLGTKST